MKVKSSDDTCIGFIIVKMLMRLKISNRSIMKESWCKLLKNQN